MKEELKKVKCSFCPDEVEVDDHLCDKEQDLSVSIVYAGTINWFPCGYASDFDGETFLLAICDECLKKADILGKKKYLFTKRKDD